MQHPPVTLRAAIAGLSCPLFWLPSSSRQFFLSLWTLLSIPFLPSLLFVQPPSSSHCQSFCEPAGSVRQSRYAQGQHTSQSGHTTSRPPLSSFSWQASLALADGSPHRRTANHFTLFRSLHPLSQR
jgi:hypothetical protein